MNTFSRLRLQGYRITSQREAIFKKIKQYPQTAEEIFTNLNKKVDLASVYRFLKLFVKNGAIRDIDFGDGKKRYELMEKQNHHHHLICDNCGRVEDVKMKEDNLLKNISVKSKFIIKQHKLEFIGLCTNCQ